jgi:hypothetical protein
MNFSSIETTEIPSKDNQKVDQSENDIEYDYLLHRKSFRLFRKFYKEKFDLHSHKHKFKRQIKSFTVEQMNDCFTTFINEEFADYLGMINELGFDLVHQAFKTVILSDIYKMKEECTQGRDFSLIRLIFTKYNAKHMIKLFSEMAYVFLFGLYMTCQGKQDSVITNQKDDNKLPFAMEFLFKTALELIPASEKEVLMQLVKK